MAAHEGLAGGLTGGAGALFAAWLAFQAIQEQLAEERDRRKRQEISAKMTAIVSLAAPVRAAAIALSNINKASFDGAIPQESDVKTFKQNATLLTDTLQFFAVKDSVMDLAVEDRILYLQIVGALSTIARSAQLKIAGVPPTLLLVEWHKMLMNMYNPLREFYPELAVAYARDSGTTAPQK